MLPSCVLYRAVAYGSEDVYDYHVFPQDTIRRSSRPWHFAEQAPEKRLLDTLVWDADRYVDTAMKYPGRPVTLGELMEDGGPGSIIVIQNDTIKFEEYYGGFDRSTVTTVFSVSKSLTSLLCGVAVREGYIRSVDDPVTDYLPELLDADTMFRHLTVEHLLQCRSGLTDCGTSAAVPLRPEIQRELFSQSVQRHGPSVLRTQRHGRC